MKARGIGSALLTGIGFRRRVGEQGLRQITVRPGLGNGLGGLDDPSLCGLERHHARADPHRDDDVGAVSTHQQRGLEDREPAVDRDEVHL